MTDLERRLARPAAPKVDPATVAAELARRADAAGLLDVAWATLDTPLGPLAGPALDRFAAARHGDEFEPRRPHLPRHRARLGT